MKESRYVSHFVVTILVSCLVLSAQVHAGQSLQPGFYSHEPADVDLRITDASSGEVCGAADGSSSVCNKALKIVVTGQESCRGSGGEKYPCTRYGYQFNYQGGEPGEAIDCQLKLVDGMGRRQTSTYKLELTASEGSVFYPSFVTYAPVEKRVILSEVSECSYRGARLATIEFMLYYEPDTGPPAGAGSTSGMPEPYFAEIPNACDYLSESLARNLMRVEKVRAGAANEHIPTFWSQCTYSGKGVAGRNAGFVFKFMLYELFDVARLEPAQLDFNASFAGGGEPPVDKLPDLGKTAFVFEKGDRTTLMVITGIQGPPDGARRPTEFIANYYLADPDTPHAARLAKLTALAREHLQEWHSR